ncbi:MAG TPA: (d)CMP kinase [Mycobacteriales bacterium]|nr:(d)CMP kinase [Mycobacteriales bacterium]
MQRRKLVVAIDGPSGSGKSTVARTLARRLGLRYLDTGAMYRAVTWLALHAELDLSDPTAVGDLASAAQLTVSIDPARPKVLADGLDVTAEVRSAAVTAAVSQVSAVPAVRAVMVQRQRELIGDGDIVVEGRDIGTTVVPDAPVKVFLTADPSTRAARRTRQELGRQTPNALAGTQAALAVRDAADAGRSASPLAQAPDAVVIDSSALDVTAVVDQIERLVRAVTE